MLIRKAAIIWVFGILAGIVAAVFAVLALTSYRPAQSFSLSLVGENSAAQAFAGSEISVATWNIGYAGLGADADFALEGGTMGRPESQDVVDRNLREISKMISALSADILFLQEVDSKAQRSFGIDQVDMVTSLRPEDAAWFSLNYKALYIPYPLNSPLGSVKSGLLTSSKFMSSESLRLQLPGSYSWPIRYFYPTRCANLIRIPDPESGGDWCLINIHLSAYDANGTLRSSQLTYIRNLMLRLYDEGNHVIVGGDWNSLFPGTDLDTFGSYTTSEEDLFWVQSIPSDWTPAGWQWAFDSSTPSCRTLEKPYVQGENLGVSIDGFLLSPDLQIESVQVLDLEFRNSDHNPVLLSAKVRG